MTEQEFEQAVVLIRNGDKNGLKEIYLAYVRFIYAVIYEILQNKENTEDVTSEFFIKLWDVAERYVPGRGHRGYLATIARNMAIDHIRKRRREVLTADIDLSGPGTGGSAFDPSGGGLGKSGGAGGVSDVRSGGSGDSGPGGVCRRSEDLDIGSGDACRRSEDSGIGSGDACRRSEDSGIGSGDACSRSEDSGIGSGDECRRSGDSGIGSGDACRRSEDSGIGSGDACSRSEDFAETGQRGLEAGAAGSRHSQGGRNGRGTPIRDYPANPVEEEVIGNIALKEALAHLKDGERQIINMKILGDMTFQEISDTLHMPMGTVTWKYRNAIGKLRRCGYEQGSETRI